MSGQNKRLTKITKPSTIRGMTGRKQYISQITEKKVSRQATHFTVRLAQMKYGTHMGAPVALARGKYEGYPFLILNVGTHPTAYVCLPRGHRYFGKHYGKANSEGFVNVHGDFTYADSYVNKSTINDRWWMGWDYGHAGLGDYVPFLPESFYTAEPKHWTREEIITEIKQVINQLEKVK